jgi:GH35 family endo-1,4-beta-xylanase
MSLRVADERNQPLDLVHQVVVPKPLEAACRFEEAVPLEERAQVTLQLSGQVTRLLADFAAARERLATSPEGYLTFAEYEGARDLGLKFFDAMIALWEEADADTWDGEAVAAARHGSITAAQGFSDVLADDTDQVAGAMEKGRRVWEQLGGDALSRRELAEATFLIAGALEKSSQLAARVEKERLLMARLENDIRNWRQRDFTLRVLDPEGGPVEGADVEIVQTGHDFLFGCNLFALGRWGDAKQSALYEKRFLKLFNLAVVPLYWSVLEEHRGRPDFAACDAMVRWAVAHHVRVKGTPLVWQETAPRWAEELPADQVGPAVRDHVRQLVERYRDTVDAWDVVNRPGPGIRIGPAAIDPADVFRWAAEARPAGRLVVNLQEAETAADLVRRLAAKGVRPDAVGLQAHQHEGPWTLDLVQRRIEQAAAAGCPVQISEVTLLGSQETENQQADAVRRFYTAAFAARSVAGITWWDLSDRFAWRNAPAGLCRTDLSPKPAYKVLDHLINERWRTDASGRTGEDGKVTVRAFFGPYRIAVKAGDRQRTAEVHLGADGPNQIEVVLAAGKQ